MEQFVRPLTAEEPTRCKCASDQVELAAAVMRRLDQQDRHIADQELRIAHLEDEVARRGEIVTRLLQSFSTSAGFFQADAAELLAESRQVPRLSQ